MEPNAIAEALNKFGPTGLTIIMMGGGLVYITRWVRDLQDKWIAQHDSFTKSLDTQREASHEALKEVVGEFKDMHTELSNSLGTRIDKLTDEVKQLRR